MYFEMEFTAPQSNWCCGSFWWKKKFCHLKIWNLFSKRVISGHWLRFYFKIFTIYSRIILIRKNRFPDPHKKHVIMNKIVNIIMSWPINIGLWYFIERFGVANPQIWLTKCWFDRGENERIYIIMGLFSTVKLHVT